MRRDENGDVEMSAGEGHDGVAVTQYGAVEMARCCCELCR